MKAKYTEFDAIGVLKSHKVNVSGKAITCSGDWSCRVCGAADFLVKRMGYHVHFKK